MILLLTFISLVILLFFFLFKSVFFLLLLLGDAVKNPRLRPFKWDRDEIWQKVLEVNTHRLTKSDFRFEITLSRWRPWRHLSHEVLLSGECTCSVRTSHLQERPLATRKHFCLQFLIHSTFVRVNKIDIVYSAVGHSGGANQAYSIRDYYSGFLWAKQQNDNCKCQSVFRPGD